MKFFQSKYLFLFFSISNIFAVPYSRYKRSDDQPQDGQFSEPTQTIITTTRSNGGQKSSIFATVTPTTTIKKENSGPTTTEPITEDKLKNNEMVSQNIEMKPLGLEISGVANRFSCLLKLPSGKRVCKPLTSFILLSHNTYDCQDRNIEIAFRGYNLELEETDEYISSFLNLEPGEIEGSQMRENTCLNFKK
jgi:hypothetical protein